MKLVKNSIIIVLILVSGNLVRAIEPANPNMTKEARALLEMFYNISGKYTLTGQHNYPVSKDRNSRFSAKYGGETPAVWSQDFGFSEKGDKDSYLSRPDIIKEAIRQHKKGSVIALCWHAVPPTADEPVTFQPDRRNPPEPGKLASVQGQLTEEQYKELMTPGTEIRKKWEAQVDEVAKFLKQLQDAQVPVLWRPYHEMNGNWFWWGGRYGENSTADIYRLIYDRYTNYHKLNNLVWVWSVDRPTEPYRKFTNFYPGNEYLDILALDVYGNDFNLDYYTGLMELSNGKPLVLGEVGNPPSLEILEKQPNWAYWVIWAGMAGNTTKELYAVYNKSPRILNQEDEAYWNVMEPFRKACGLPLLPVKSEITVDFSGNWILNESKSNPGGGMFGATPAYKMEIEQDGDLILKTSYSIVEWDNDQITNDEMILDGSESVLTGNNNTEKRITAKWDAETESIRINTLSKFSFGGRNMESKASEEWKLSENGKVLVIKSVSSGFGGNERTSELIFDKKN
ncbi:MAG: hypothetical protein JXR31_07900 [Prolixibacteraceae bacterium]|nr:hypothetical protein [Prolixibacteraceae bacterium]MBN2774156.1 hypothetical protein [Prolixibacteraceae bacterium]